MGGLSHLAPVAYPPTDTRPVDVTGAHGGWPWLVHATVGADGNVEHCRDALPTFDCASLLAAVTARRTFTPLRRIPTVV